MNLGGNPLMRKKWAKTSAKVALLTAGFVVIGSGAGYADITSGDFGAGSGNQLRVPASAPINASGNAGSVLGQARAMAHSGASVHNHSHDMLTSGKFALLGGNQADVPASAPVNATGNALTGGGQAWALGHGHADVVNGHGRHHRSYSAARSAVANVTHTAHKALPQAASPTMPSPLSSLTDSVRALPGTQALTQVSQTLPVSKLPLKKKRHLMGSGHDGGMFSHGDFGLLSGNQAYTPVSVPVNACGNAAAVLGQAFAACKGSASVHNDGAGADGMYTSGRFGALGGNQLNAPISAPVNLCGNAASLGGQALALCKGRATVDNGGGRHHRVYTPQASMPTMPQAPEAAPQQGPVPAPKPELPKAKLPKLPVKVNAPKAAGVAPAPMATTPQVPSLAVPKPQAPKVNLPKASAPKVNLPKPSMPKVTMPKPKLPSVDMPKPQAPKAEVSLPSAPHEVADCGCAPQAKSITGGDDNSVIHTAKKKDDTVGDLSSNLLNNRQAPVSLTDVTSDK